MPDHKLYKLLGPDGAIYLSHQPGLFGGHRRGRGYGRMDCRAALRAIAKGGYVQHRVFIADEATAIAAGYRPCAVCLPDRYALWKLACAQVDVPRLVRSRARRQPALDIYRDLVAVKGFHDGGNAALARALVP
jgi:hypothetical protein